MCIHCADMLALCGVGGNGAKRSRQEADEDADDDDRPKRQRAAPQAFVAGPASATGGPGKMRTTL